MHYEIHSLQYTICNFFLFLLWTLWPRYVKFVIDGQVCYLQISTKCIYFAISRTKWSNICAKSKIVLFHFWKTHMALINIHKSIFSTQTWFVDFCIIPCLQFPLRRGKKSIFWVKSLSILMKWTLFYILVGSHKTAFDRYISGFSHFQYL